MKVREDPVATRAHYLPKILCVQGKARNEGFENRKLLTVSSSSRLTGLPLSFIFTSDFVHLFMPKLVKIEFSYTIVRNLAKKSSKKQNFADSGL